MDIPVISLVTRAGWISRIIFLVLLVFSFIIWSVIINRVVYIAWVRKMHRQFMGKFSKLVKLTEIENFDDKILQSPLGMVGKAGAEEYRRIIADAQSHTQVKDWSFYLQSQFSIAAEKMGTELSAGVTKLDRGVFILAIISSTAPFVGLLGTVWGIMDSFFQIGQQGSASLPVVAPGIAEALVATAFALAVAIPAVFAYNYINHVIERTETQMEEHKDLILSRIRREILMLLYGQKTKNTTST